jgi:hypothetical protein
MLPHKADVTAFGSSLPTNGNASLLCVLPEAYQAFDKVLHPAVELG